MLSSLHNLPRPFACQISKVVGLGPQWTYLLLACLSVGPAESGVRAWATKNRCTIPTFTGTAGRFEDDTELDGTAALKIEAASSGSPPHLGSSSSPRAASAEGRRRTRCLQRMAGQRPNSYIGPISGIGWGANMRCWQLPHHQLGGDHTERNGEGDLRHSRGLYRLRLRTRVLADGWYRAGRQ